MSMLTKVCKRCHTRKPVEDFYSGGGLVCKKCDNARARNATVEKLARHRARTRAYSRLADAHRDEFTMLMADEYQLALAEARGLAGEPVKFMPGKRMPGETAADRVREDVGRCPLCINRHDRGHVCSACGARPQIIGPVTAPAYRAAPVERRIGA